MVVDEELASHGVANELILFNNLPDRTKAITVKDSLDTDLAEGDDYQITQSGIQFVESGGIDILGVKVSYTTPVG